MDSGNKRVVSVLVFFIVVAAAAASAAGIFSGGGPGPFAYESIRGQEILIYGKGIYKHMSEEVAVQGIAQDYVTLFAGIPLLLVSLYWAGKGSLRGRYLLAGVLGYFFVTYLFYLIMGMYNRLFLVYAFLLGTTFFAFTITMLSFNINKLPGIFSKKTPVKLAGGFLIFNTFAIGFLWLSRVVPPLIDGSVYPVELEHYTTLIVQGMDLGLLLPIAMVTGILLYRKRAFGYLLGPVYLVFLSLLMTALTAKIINMGINGYEIFPVIFIIPTFALISIVLSILLIRSVKGITS